MSLRVYTYYEDIKFPEQDRLIKLWRESWARNGYESVVLSRADAEAHPFYPEFSEKIQSLHLQITGKKIAAYGMACWLRWLAYAARGEGRFYVCDYDVINHRLEPLEPSPGLWFLDSDCPCIASGDASEFERLCRNFCSHAEDRLEGFARIYRESGFVWFHDQEFLTIARKLGVEIGEMSRERDEFLGIPSEGEFWKRKVVHYGHSIVARHCKANEKAYSDSARCDLIEESLSRR